MDIKQEKKRLNIPDFKCQDDIRKCVKHYSKLYGNESYFRVTKCVDAGFINPCYHVKATLSEIDHQIIKYYRNRLVELWNMPLNQLLTLFRCL